MMRAITNRKRKTLLCDFVNQYCAWAREREREREKALCMQLLSRQKLVASLEPLCIAVQH